LPSRCETARPVPRAAGFPASAGCSSPKPGSSTAKARNAQGAPVRSCVRTSPCQVSTGTGLADRLPAQLEAAALLRQAEAEGGFGTVLKRGDPDRGALVLLVARRGIHSACLE